VEGSLDPDDYDIENGPYPTWPTPDGVNEKITDMWHATVNSRGRFVTSRSAEDLADELIAFMQEIKLLNLSGAPVTVNGDELYSEISDEVRLFQSKFYSETWNGDVLAFKVDVNTGALIQPALWSAAWKLRDLTYESRKIATYDGTSGGVAFRFDSLADYQKSMLDAGWATNSTLARNIVNYLRGDGSKEMDNGGTFRNRTWSIDDDTHPNNGQIIASSKLGDIVSSSPAHKNGVLYAGSNDGMLHAFDAATGSELFAYVPNLVFYNLAALKDAVYSHKYYVDQSPTVAFIDTAGMSSLLVGGLGKGGKGYYALDVSGVKPDEGRVPNNESAVADMVKWEYPNLNTAATEKADMGYSFGRPAIVQSNDPRYPWVVIVNNGYNSTNGHAVLFILDPDTGALIKRIDTQAGSCNGLSTAVAVDKNFDDKVDYIYAGDLAGHLWKFDLSRVDSADWDVAFKEGGVPKPLFKTPAQPITAKPDVMRHCTKEGYMVLFGTGRYLDEDDLNDTSPQSIYGIWDYGDDGDDREYVGALSGGTITDTNLPSTVSLLSQAIASSGVTTVNGKHVRTLTDNLPNWMVTSHDGSRCGETAGSTECDPNGVGSNPDPLRTVGWRFNLPTSGERVVGNVMVRGGILIAVTNIPQASVCSSAASSWIMEMNACSGSRLTEAQFDINGDGCVNADDLVNIGTETIPIMAVPGGIYSEGRLKEPPILRNGNLEVMYLSSSGGLIVTQLQRATRMGLQWWRLIRP
jgi:Tfp pilus tip-associated adhesin PilY1